MKKAWKKIGIFIMVMLMTVLVICENIGIPNVITAFAGSNDKVMMGIPVLDGVVDEIYKQSLTLSTGVGDNAYTDEWTEDQGNIYFLYSENYLYICADIKDDSVVSAGELYVSGTTNSWENDCCEFRLSLDGGTTTFKVGIDAYGLKVHSTASDMAKTDYSKILYRTTYNDLEENSGYVIEAAIPCTEGILDVDAAGKLGFKLQLNDLDYDGSLRSFATDYAGEGAKGLVYYDLSSEVVSGGTTTGDEDLYSIYGNNTEESDYQKLSFGGDDANYKMKGNGSYKENATEWHGIWTKNTELGTIGVGYSAKAVDGAASGARYVMKGYFDTSKLMYDAEYKYICVLYAAQNPADVSSVQMVLNNNGTGGGTIILDSDIINTNGNFVFTAPCELTDAMKTRLAKPAWCNLNFVTDVEGGCYQVKAYYFFKTEEEANDFIRDYQKLSFAQGGNYTIKTGTGLGVQETDEELGVINVVYDAASSIKNTNYILKGYFNKNVETYKTEYKYIRVLYAAQNPEGVDTVEMRLKNDGSPYTVLTLDSAVENTNGQFVLSDPCELTEDIIARLAQPAWCSLEFMTTEEGGCYQVEAYYFFKTLKEAQMFDQSLDDKTIQVNGNDITNYRIVVPEDGIGNEMEYAKTLKYQIYGLSGAKIPVVYDSEEATQYELLIGKTNRPESQTYYSGGGRFHPSYSRYSVTQYCVDRINDKVVLISAMAPAVEDSVSLLSYKLESGENPVNLTDERIGEGILSYGASTWPEVTNVAEPVQFEDGFDTNEGYWSTDSDKNGWIFAAENDNNVFSTGNHASALSYLHVFEKNVSFETKWKYTSATENGSAGLLLRHTADYGWIKLGYDFELEEWFIDSREGEDFLCYRLASAKADLTDGQWYNLKAVVNGTVAELYIDGVKILSTNALTQLTPGKIGVFAEDVSAMVDDVDIYLLSGQGSIMKNVVHTKLPDDVYREGGSIWEMEDGSLRYLGRSDGVPMGGSFASYDSGKTWVRTEPWTQVEGSYAQILRLQNGNFLQIRSEKDSEGVKYRVAQISTDEGQTWTTVGTICPAVYAQKAANGKDVGAGNMNDKITQMSDGRIFYCQSYETSSTVNGYLKVFNEFYYSDDNGVTWTKSETDSFEIEGNETQSKFGECKILETSTPGVLRIYNSWNWYGCIVYSESTDNGVTWGPLQKMTDFVCACSSMQFVKDIYADNNSTYYMVWVKDDGGKVIEGNRGLPRTHLALAKTTDGINWEPLGDVWRYESRFEDITQIVDPVVQVTEEYVIVGSGISEKIQSGKSHNAQRQHIYSILKSTLEEMPEPTVTPEPTAEPTATPEPTSAPTEAPTTAPTESPSTEPTVTPTPSTEPTAEPTTSPTPEAVEIVADKSDESYTVGSDGTVTIYCTGELDEFERVEVDGVEVDKSNYTLEEGSTILTFKASYLDTLAPGEHTVKMIYTGDRSVVTTLSATERVAPDNNIPSDNTADDEVTDETVGNSTAVPAVNATGTVTGDSSNFGLWMMLMLISIIGVAAVIVNKCKKN
ncbi:MAG: exo-alpha-sialidase [Lachnospiraceae bacterium]|nr:exo-alpha-sialidase [Lachnospiraceae bacterium]